MGKISTVTFVVAMAMANLAPTVAVDQCGIDLVNEICPGIDTSNKNWGNSSVRGEYSLLLAGEAVSGSCEVVNGPVADAIEKMVPKWTENLNKSVCDELCQQQPGLTACEAKKNADSEGKQASAERQLGEKSSEEEAACAAAKEARKKEKAEKKAEREAAQAAKKKAQADKKKAEDAAKKDK